MRPFKVFLEWLVKDDPMTDWLTVLACVYFIAGGILSMIGSIIILCRELSKGG